MGASDHAFAASIADTYDRRLGPVVFAPYARDLARRIDRCPPGPVLETACGTGILTRELRRWLCPSVPLIATDINQGMLDYAQARLDGLEQVQWQLADAAMLPFPARTFAAIACQFGMMFVRDLDAAFREAARVLSEGGVLAFSVWDSLASNPWCRVVDETLRGLFLEDPRHFFRVAFGLHERRLLRRKLGVHGFDNVTLDAVPLAVCSSSAALLAVGQVEGTPLSASLRQQGIATDRVVHAVTEALTLLGGERPFRSTMRALVVTARKRSAATSPNAG